MNRERFSAIAHAALDICNPIGEAKLLRCLHLLNPHGPGEASTTIADFGCGKAGVLALALTHLPGRAIGIDSSQFMLDAARELLSQRRLLDRVTLHKGDAAESISQLGLTHLSLALCIGSTHAFTNLAGTLAALKPIIRPGGHLLIGEGFWLVPPSQAYLTALGATIDSYLTHAGNIAACFAAGFTPIHACTASQDEWDEYEWAYSRGIESFVEDNPQDPDAASMLTRSRNWRETYVTLGRGVLGFGVYVLRATSAAK